MATTKSLNSEDSVYVTTFYGGADRGRCYTFTQNIDGRRVKTTVNELELQAMLWLTSRSETGVDDGIRPSFDA